MQQMSLFEEPPPTGAAPVWNALDEQPRAEIVRQLAQLIVKTIAALEDTHDE